MALYGTVPPFEDPEIPIDPRPIPDLVPLGLLPRFLRLLGFHGPADRGPGVGAARGARGIALGMAVMGWPWEMAQRNWGFHGIFMDFIED